MLPIHFHVLFVQRRIYQRAALQQVQAPGMHSGHLRKDKQACSVYRFQALRPKPCLVISPLARVISIVTLKMTLLITTLEPPSNPHSPQPSSSETRKPLIMLEPQQEALMELLTGNDRKSQAPVFQLRLNAVAEN